MTRTVGIEDLAKLLAAKPGRQITAIAGPPASGKSTIAEQLAEAINAIEPGSAAVFPMDGYHFDDIVLNERGHRARKGAPHTFDVAGYRHTLQRLRQGDEAEIAVPVFDRSIEIARAGARIISDQTRHIITEGNYLLLDQGPWTSLSDAFDQTVWIDVPRDTLKARLEERWAQMAEGARRVQIDQNDLVNVDLVQGSSRAADFVIG